MSHNLMPDCPHCHSANVITRNRGRKSAVMLGGLAGGISSAATVWHGARMGAAVGAVAGPTGALLSAVAGAVLAALAGGAAGCAAGGVVGDLIDDKVLNNYRCLACGHRFSRSTVPDEPAPSAQTAQAHNPTAHPMAHPAAPRQYPYGHVDPHEDPDEEDHPPYGFYHRYPYPFHPAAHG